MEMGAQRDKVARLRSRRASGTSVFLWILSGFYRPAFSKLLKGLLARGCPASPPFSRALRSGQRLNFQLSSPRGQAAPGAPAAGAVCGSWLPPFTP